MGGYNQGFWNKEAGKSGLAITLIIVYIVLKFFTLGGYSTDLLLSSIWFGAIVVSALAADLFNNIESWIYNSMIIVENRNLTKEERISMIKTQLEIAVDRYMSVFMIVNGFESAIKKIFSNITKIVKGVITVKELIVIFGYVVYDLLIRAGGITLIEPWDKMIIFAVLIILKVIDAKSGTAELISTMYQNINEIKDADKLLDKIANNIKDLAHMYNIETTHEANLKTALSVLMNYIPKLSEEDKEILKKAIF